MAMVGRIVNWDEKHGFGLIESSGIPKRVFFHVRDMDVEALPPFISERVVFDMERDLNGCGIAIHILPII